MTDPVMLLSQLHGEGRVTFRALRAAGFYTLGAIAQAPLQTLADRAHLSPRTARRLKAGVEELIGKGIGPGVSSDEPAAAPRTAAARNGRKPGRAGGRLGLSEGVLHEEALLLGQGADPDARPTPAAVAPGPIEAAAKAAADLSRRATVSAADSGDAGVEPRPTFWGFGQERPPAADNSTVYTVARRR